MHCFHGGGPIRASLLVLTLWAVLGGVDRKVGEADAAQIQDSSVEFAEQADLVGALRGQDQFGHAVLH
jgi:hypothetical protein